jgi:hypothetical protein
MKYMPGKCTWFQDTLKKWSISEREWIQVVTREGFYAKDGENDCVEIRPLPDGFYEFNFIMKRKNHETWGMKLEKNQKNLKLDQLPKDLHARINMVRMLPNYTYTGGLGYKFDSDLFTVLITSEELDFLMSV